MFVVAFAMAVAVVGAQHAVPGANAWHLDDQSFALSSRRSVFRDEGSAFASSSGFAFVVRVVAASTSSRNAPPKPLRASIRRADKTSRARKSRPATTSQSWTA